MPPFDITDNAVQAYRQIWAERRYLVRLAVVPVLIKFVCTMVVGVLGLKDDFLKAAIIYLPAFFTEGWMLAHLMRLIFLGQRWPFQPTGDAVADERVLQDRFRGVMGGMVSYVLINFILAGLVYGLMQLETLMSPDGEKVNILVFAASLASVAVMVWAFRLYWSFIPAALNYPVRDYLRALGGMRVSFYMIGTWLICYLPLLFLFMLLAASTVSMAGGLPTLLNFFITLGQVIVGTASTMVAAAGIGFAIRAMMKPE